MPVVVIQVIGGILVALTMASSGVANINKQIQQRNQIVNEQIQDELDELKDDYEYCEKVYIKNLIDDGEIDEEIDQDELNDIKDEVAATYSREYESRIDISQRTIEYMKKQLDKSDVEYMERRSKLSGDSINQQVVNKWLNKFIVNE